MIDVRGREPRARLSPRLATATVSAVFCLFCVLSLLYVFAASGLPSWQRWVTVACTLPVLGFQILLAGRHGARFRRKRPGYAALAAQAVLGFGPMLVFSDQYIALPHFVVASCLLILKPPWSWTAFAAGVAAMGAIPILTLNPSNNLTFNVAQGAGAAIATGFAVYGLTMLAELMREVLAARAELARMAVAAERLRFARDLHDLLGYGLSAIALKSELISRVLIRDPARAREELTTVSAMSRQALADTRAVAGGYRELSLTEEAVSARSILAAAGIDADIDIDDAAMPPRVRTVLATMLREGVTNLLRHSEATRCRLAVRRHAGHIEFELVNDGVRQASGSPGTPAGRGIRNLSDRVTATGGVLAAGVTADGDYRLGATLPATPPATPRSASPPDGENGSAGRTGTGTGSAAAAHAPEADAGELRARLAPRVATATVWVVFCGFFALGVYYLFTASSSEPWQKWVTLACMVPLLVFQLLLASGPGARLRRTGLGLAVLPVLAVLGFAPLFAFDDQPVTPPHFVVGSCLLILRPWWNWAAVAVCMAAAGSVPFVSASSDYNLTFDVVYAVVAALATGLVVYGLTMMVDLVRDVTAARAELARMAVAAERLRFARDLHDLLGYGLSAIALKSELISRVLTRDPGRAQRELTQIIEISRQALADTRAVASGPRELSLAEEAASARSLLSAAGVDMRIDIEAVPTTMSPRVDSVLATMLREGVTNLLRHSEATRCDLVIRRTGDRMEFELVNDGVPRPGEPPAAGGGRGIQNLSDRVTATGGMLTAGVTADGRYRLGAAFPVDAAVVAHSSRSSA